MVPPMSGFQVTLVSPEHLLYADEVNQVDLPGAEGDLGVLAGHAPIVTMLRPGIATMIRDDARESFVLLGGLAEFSNGQLTILAETAAPVGEFDLAALKDRIDELENRLSQTAPGAELDNAIARLDHYKAIRVTLTQATAF
jgi:F-type H+-transporting ATPase subunit epsilon